MKALLKLTAACGMLIGLCSSPARAAQEGDFLYEPTPIGAALTGYKGIGSEVIVPDMLGGQPVVRIEGPAFADNSALTRVTLPNSLIYIGERVFLNCTSLVSIVIPDRVVSIGWNAFSGCTSLANATIGSSVATIGGYVFSNCTSLTSITIPNSVTSIDWSVFAGCASLANVNIGSGLASMGGYVFSSCTNLTSIEVSPQNTIFGSLDGVLYDKKRAALLWYPSGKNGTFIIPDGVSFIEQGAFSGCVGLTDVAIPDGITFIQPAAFAGCASLKSIVIPGTIIAIGKIAFVGCASLTNVTILEGNIAPTGGGSIGERAFAGCENLATVSIGSGVSIIGNNAFSGSAKLTSVRLANGVSTIGYSAFSACPSLRRITIPNSVTSIDWYAFEGCTSLADVSVGSGLASLGGYVFSGCTNLASIDVAPQNSTFGSLDGVIYDKQRTVLVLCPGGKTGTFTVPSGVIFIDQGAFFNNTRLTGITIPNTVTAIKDAAFSGCIGLTAIKLPNDLISIGGDTFSGCTSLTSVVIPASTTTIGREAFSACTSLTNVTILDSSNIPNSVGAIGERAFAGCVSLASVSIGSSITRIGLNAFDSCTSLASVSIGSSITSMDAYVFSGCTSLTAIEVASMNPVFSSVGGVLYNKDRTTLLECPRGKSGAFTVPRGVTSIGSGAFFDCAKLTSITISDGVIFIQDKAFLGCSRLVSIVVPASVRAIRAWAFAGCQSLTGAFFQGTPPSVIESFFGFHVDVFPQSITIYRLAGATGWGETFASRRTAIWVPLPEYDGWVAATGLSFRYPKASEPTDDPDRDGFTNFEELQSATDPTDPSSHLALALTAWPSELSDADKTPVPAGQLAIYFRSVPGKTYGLVGFQALGGGKSPNPSDGTPSAAQPILLRVTTATHPQTRLLVEAPAASQGGPANGFYRVFALSEQGITPAAAAALSLAQRRAQRFAFRQRKAVLRADEWLEDSLSFAGGASY